MRKEKNSQSYIYSPTDLVKFMESDFASWMDRFYLDFPDNAVPDVTDELQKLLQDRGNRHEKDYLLKLRSEGKDICEISNKSDNYTETVEAIKSSRDIIYQAALHLEDFAGYADFLIRDEQKSSLNKPIYQVWDTKLALNPKPYFLIQLCCYAEMLAAIQGSRPETIGIILGDGTDRSFRTDDYFYFYLHLKEAFLQQQRSFDPNNPPEIDGMADHGRWVSHAERILEESDHLSRVANIRKTQIKKFNQIGIKTMKQLAETELSHIADMASETFAILKRQAQLQIDSIDKDYVPYRFIKPDAADSRRGLALLPPASSLDICFDMEGYPHAEGGLEYLFGVTFQENNSLQFRDWWAHNSIKEKLAFEDFIDWTHARWKSDPTVHIYHYGHYEINALRKLAGRYSTRVEELDDLLRNEVFVNLLNVVRQSIQIGQPAYSIKNVELLYKGKRSGNIAKAVDSIVQYQKWLTEQDGDNWQNSKILADIRSYNKDDCDSTWLLMSWLRNLQNQEKVHFILNPSKEEKQKESDSALARKQATQLALTLLAALPEEGAYSETHKLQELLAYSLEFHWREAKPVFWAKYDRAAMTEDELIDDINCLGTLKRITRQGLPEKQSFLYDYQYNPAQDTKIKNGDKCFSHDLSMKCEVTKIDTDSGRIQIKLGRKQNHPPLERLNLIPDEYVPADTIANAIYDMVLLWSNTGKLPPAIKDFLLRKPPRIRNYTAGPIIKSHSNFLQSVTNVITNLDNSTLCIQGPPGSGKTYTAARVIHHLLRQGKRIGVTSNSHKAIAKLMEDIAKNAPLDCRNIAAAKVQSKKDDFLLEDQRKFVFKVRSKNIENALSEGYQLIGGTAWAFSNGLATDQFDYLFVDEAGQVSIANLLGMSRSTKNIVLIGDQMQLSQPIKGIHPVESGQSTLEYLLQGQQTIRDDFGIFLGTTRRMHPDLCQFISGAVYENRLKSSPETSNYILSLPENHDGIITKSSGIIHVPVEHDGNSQASDEEVKVIIQIVQELLLCKMPKPDGQLGLITIEDILFMAPYNMQVTKLKERIPGAYIGSVDKFQGQEKPVVIISMCSSSGDASPRGIEFLFNKNRLNVAISRAKALAIVVGHPALARTRCAKVEQMKLVNLFCRIASHRSLPTSISADNLILSKASI